MAFRIEQLTVKAQEAVAQAQHRATEQGNPQIESLHLLAGLLAETDGIVDPLLEKMGVNLGQLNSTVESEIDRLPKTSGGAAPKAGRVSVPITGGVLSCSKTQ